MKKESRKSPEASSLRQKAEKEFGSMDLKNPNVTEVALKKSEERFRQVAESTGELIWEVDNGGVFTYVSSISESILGYKPEEIIGKKHYYDFFIPEEMSRLREEASRIIERKGIFKKFEHLNLHKKGKVVTLETNGFPILDDEGAVTGYRGADKDISTQKKYEYELLERNKLLNEINTYALQITSVRSDLLYQFILSNIKEYTGASLVLINLYDSVKHELVTEYASTSDSENSIFLKILGKNVIGFRSRVTGEKYNQMISEIVGKEDTLTGVSFGAISPAMGKIIKKLTGYEWFQGIVLKHDEKLVGTIVLSGKKGIKPPDNQNLLAFAGITANAIARAMAEKLLKESDEIFRNFMETSPVYVFFKDKNLRALRMSRNFEKMLGKPLDELLGKSMHEILPADFASKIISDDKEVLKKGSVITFDDELNGRYYSTIKFPVFINGKQQYLAGYTIDVTEQRIADEALKLSESNYRNLFENSIVGVSQASLEGKLIRINVAYAHMYGYPGPEEMMSAVTNVSQLYAHTSERDEILEILKEKGVIAPRELEVVRRDGTHFYVLVVAREIRDLSGKVVCYQADHVDITNLKKAEEELKHANTRFQNAMEASRMAWWEMDTTTGSVIFHENKALMLGYRPDQFTHYTDFTKLLHPDDYESAMTAMRDFLEHKADRYDTEYRIRNSKNQYTWYRDVGGATEVDSSGNPTKVSGLVIDISEAKLADENIKETNAKLARAQRLAHIASWEDYLPTGELHWSDEMYHIMGLDATKPPNIEDVMILFPQEEKERFRKAVNSAISDGEPYSMDYKIIRPDGMVRYIHDEGEIAYDDSGTATWMFGTTQDITDRKFAEQKIIESESRYHDLFEHSVVPILEEDFSEVKKLFDRLKKKKVKNFRLYFNNHPDKVALCASLIKITDQNRTSLDFLGIKDQKNFVLELPAFFNSDSLKVFGEELIALAEGKMDFESDFPIQMPDGKLKQLHISVQVDPGYYKSLARVLVSWIDITDRINYEQILMKSSQELRKLTQHMEELRENERATIARDLHDDLGQRLTALNMDIAWIKSRMGVQSRAVENKIKGMVKILNGTIESVQKISYGLRPSILDDLGLYSAIEWQLSEFKKSTGISFSLSFVPKEIDMENKISLAVFRIIQESLTNIARHAQATKVSVNLKCDLNSLKLVVRDNGIGINKENLNSNLSFGLIGMKERAGTYGGEVTFRSKPGEGTVVTLTIPMNARQLVIQNENL